MRLAEHLAEAKCFIFLWHLHSKSGTYQHMWNFCYCCRQHRCHCQAVYSLIRHAMNVCDLCAGWHEEAERDVCKAHCE